MESEERPSKMRKLEHGIDSEQTEQPAAESQYLDTSQSEAKIPDVVVGGPEATTKPGTIDAIDEPGQPAISANGKSNPPNETSHSEQVSTEEPGTSTNGNSFQPNAPPQPVQTPAEEPKSTPKFEIDPTLSKNQQKKLRKRLEWEAGREDRKVIRKEKQKEKRERIRAEKAALPAEVVAQKEAAKSHQPRPRQLPITILIDCDFDDLMRDKERISLSSQITRCYSDNRGSPYRAHLTLASFGGNLKERYDGVLEGVYKLWKPFRTFSEKFAEVAEMAKTWMSDPKDNYLVGPGFAKYADQDQEKLKAEGEIIYLSSEGDEDLTELKPYSTYIIGGLVDKNREKGICHKRAVAVGIKTKRLPIGKFMDMSSRKVLATNHVNEIMVRWLECGDWGEAFMKVIPKRKGGTLKGGGDGDEDEDDE